MRNTERTKNTSVDEGPDLKALALNRELESSPTEQRSEATPPSLTEEFMFPLEPEDRDGTQKVNLFLKEAAKEFLVQMNSGEPKLIRSALSNFSALVEEPGIAETTYNVLSEGPDLFHNEPDLKALALDAFLSYLSRPHGFENLTKVLRDDWLGKEIARVFSPNLSSSEQESKSLTDVALYYFLRTDSAAGQVIAARVLTKLPVRDVADYLVSLLDDKNLATTKRRHIAGILGSHPEAVKCLRGLVSRVLPDRYASLQECFEHHPGKFYTQMVLGAATGFSAAFVAALVLPKNPLFLGITIVGVSGTVCWRFVNRLYRKLNTSLSSNPNHEVDLDAAKALRKLLERQDLPPELSRNMTALRNHLKQNLPRITDLKLRAEINRGLEEYEKV